ncbi:VWFA and cache domain-containing protein 1-like isoform X12 [Mytilus californianus]|uniref:VWFA and cache domain-containing protein 1-like isoform X12 n=1 Tax=Mytilus californianus TaxID=6549 RepID=UPI002247230B|nr:VWFA and cache domain-containing protein 1-like isoform X12 [Mytilus californianus]
MYINTKMLTPKRLNHDIKNTCNVLEVTMKVTILLALSCYAYGVIAQDLDASLLSNRLKEIKKSIGIDYLQEEFNKLPFTTKTGNGTKLLADIQDKLAASLVGFKNVLDAVKDEVFQNENRFTTQTTLPHCCDKHGTYVYDPKFRKEVDFSTACVTKSYSSTSDAKYPHNTVSDIMKMQYDQNKNVLWQHYGTLEGVSIIYPSTYWNDCYNYDPRFRSAFAATASPKDKDVVILIDSSSSMKQISGVTSKSKMSIAKEAARTVIETLNPNDRVAVISFSSGVSVPGEDANHDCYKDTLSFASKTNIDKLQEFVSLYIQESNTGDTNFENVLIKAFSYLGSTNNNVDVSTRDQVILLLTDGGSNDGRDPREVIRDENAKLQNRVIVFTYLLGPGATNEIKQQLREMATQVKSNSSYGNIREGHFTYVDQNQHASLSMEMATFYVQLRSGQINTNPVYSIPYVDPFSERGLITSMCKTVYGTLGSMQGVSCTDVKLSELLKEVEYFEEGNSSYGFMIDNTGRALIHPLLPEPAFVEINEDPVLVDITSLERTSGTVDIINSMKRGESGKKTLPNVYFTLSRGRLVNEGSRYLYLQATYFWGPVQNTRFYLCIVLSEETHTVISEADFDISNSEMDNVFLYHNRSLTFDSQPNCRFNYRKVTLAQSATKFTPSAFSNPFQYIDETETGLDVKEYTDYLTRKSFQNPGFKDDVRATVWATYKAEQFWKQQPASHLAWRYIGTKAGVIRVYPAVTLTKSYDHEKRTWWRETTSHPGIIYITSPYQDAWGSGILLTLAHTIFKRGSNQVTAVVGTDFPLQYFSYFIDNIYPVCTTKDFKCMIIDDSGFLVIHQAFKETTDPEYFDDPKHITILEPTIAEAMKENDVFNRLTCKDLSTNKELQSFRVTLPAGRSTGLSFDQTDNKFELRPVVDTNIFILRIKKELTSSACKCDSNVQPDFRECNNNCDCICYKPIVYNVCTNVYTTTIADSSLPCSARLLDKSGISINENLTGLQSCFDPKCNEKTTKKDCYSEFQCSWCEFTFKGEIIPEPCCRIKGECSFGKTKDSNSNICDASHTETLPEVAEGQSTGAVVGGAIGGLFAVVLIVGGVIFLLRYLHIKDNCDKEDPYLYAIPDHLDLQSAQNYGFESSGQCNPPPATSNLSSGSVSNGVRHSYMSVVSDESRYDKPTE